MESQFKDSRRIACRTTVVGATAVYARAMICLLCALSVASLLGTSAAWATSPCYQWYIRNNILSPPNVSWTSPLETSPNAVLKDLLNYCNSTGAGPSDTQPHCELNPNWYCYQNCTYTNGSVTLNTDGYPGYSAWVKECGQNSLGTPGCAPWAGTPMAAQNNANGCSVYVRAVAPPQAQCGKNCNSVSDPVNPANGGVYTSTTDLPNAEDGLMFRRYYNSVDPGSAPNLPTGWRYSFSRSIQPWYGGTGYAGTYTASALTSSLYTDEATACTSGFAQIKAAVSSWANATASYANGVCTLSVGSTQIGTLPLLYSSQPTPDPSTEQLIGYAATRDDGQVVSFLLNGGTIAAPPGTGLRLRKTSSGFTLTDDEDSVEAYNASGTLQSVTSRAGVVDTIAYDTSGRLSSITDSFGHSLALSYDSQGRLATVTGN